jgi:threonine/homoserine efflux transporter RhtA
MSSIVIEALALLTFGGLTIYYIVRRRLRHFVWSVAVLTGACISSLIMSLNAPDAPQPVGTLWRLANVALFISGGILYQRAWNRRHSPGSESDGPT